MTDTLKWEYFVETFGGGIRGVNMEEVQAGLNELGEQSWEVLGVHQMQGTSKLCVFAKRPLTEAVRKQRSREERGW
ncbi:MAG: hypothetical protein JXA25_06190 [Anaerolineales bacterium]|nr:hypothetical protein [Anaerolineales bacterium]